MLRITDICSCIYAFGCKLSLVRLCDSDFGITPVDDITIGIICAAFCFHIAHISFASSWYLFCLSVIVLMRLCVFGTTMSIKKVIHYYYYYYKLKMCKNWILVYNTYYNISFCNIGKAESGILPIYWHFSIFRSENVCGLLYVYTIPYSVTKLWAKYRSMPLDREE